jgi:hypothetical protein
MTQYVDVYSISDEQFVEWWLDAYDKNIGLGGLCAEHNLEYTRVSGRGSKLRQAGVKLPTMRARTTVNTVLETNVKKLNKMVTDKLGVEALTWRNR